MGFRSSRGFSRAVSLRRKTAWEDGPGGTLSTVKSTGGPIILGTGAQLLQDGLTVVRLRGKFRMFIAAATTAGDGHVGAFGINIVKGPAFAIGVTAVPTPITNQDSEDWLFWMPLQLGASFATEGWGNAGSDFEDWMVDTKSMRKLELGDVIYASVETVLTGTASTRLYFDSRILLKLA